MGHGAIFDLDRPGTTLENVGILFIGSVPLTLMYSFATKPLIILLLVAATAISGLAPAVSGCDVSRASQVGTDCCGECQSVAIDATVGCCAKPRPQSECRCACNEQPPPCPAKRQGPDERKEVRYTETTERPHSRVFSLHTLSGSKEVSESLVLTPRGRQAVLCRWLT